MIDGKFTDWSDWSACSVSCGGGYQLAVRSCDPTFTSTDCRGDTIKTKLCNANLCPGMWYAWSSWSGCSQTCGGDGIEVKFRRCKYYWGNRKLCTDGRQQIETKRCIENICPDNSPQKDDITTPPIPRPRVLTTTPAVPITPPVNDCIAENLSFDILFVNDETGSIGFDDYQKSLEFIVQSMKSFKGAIDSGEVYVGMVTYSDHPKVKIPLGKHRFDELSTGILDVLYSGGNTKTGKAIEYAQREILLNGRHDKTHVMVIITDGVSQDEITKAAQKARDTGFVLMAVGVGAGIDKDQLHEMAGVDGKNFGTLVYEVDDFDALESITQKISSIICLSHKKGHIESHHDEDDDKCHPKATLIDGLCICQPEYEGDGYECVEKENQSKVPAGKIYSHSDCVFPFTYKGQTYNECIKRNHHRLWCSTSSTFFGFYRNCQLTDIKNV